MQKISHYSLGEMYYSKSEKEKKKGELTNNKNTDLWALIRARRFAAYSLHNNPLTGTLTLFGSALYHRVSAKLNDKASIKVWRYSLELWVIPGLEKRVSIV